MSKQATYTRKNKGHLNRSLLRLQQHVDKRARFITDFHEVYKFPKHKTRANLRRLRRINSAIGFLLNLDEKL